jgi:hypothetical protein
LPAALDLLPSAPDRLGCKLSVEAGTPLELELLGQLVGAEAELRKLLAPLYRIAAPERETISTLPYWDAQGLLSEDEDAEYTHERSRYVFRPIPVEGNAPSSITSGDGREPTTAPPERCSWPAAPWRPLHPTPRPSRIARR